MLKNPYIFPLVGLFVLGALYFVQKELGGTVGKPAVQVALPPPTKIELLLTYRDAAHGDLDCGQNSKLSWPARGTIEWDYYGCRDTTLRGTPFLTISRAEGQKLVVTCGTNGGGDSVAVAIHGMVVQKKALLLLEKMPVHMRLDWDTTQVVFCLNGRKTGEWPPLKELSIGDSVFLSLTVASREPSGVSGHDIRDLNFFRRP